MFDRRGYHLIHVGLGRLQRCRHRHDCVPSSDVAASGELGDEALDREPRIIRLRRRARRSRCASCRSMSRTAAPSTTGTTSTSSPSSRRSPLGSREWRRDDAHVVLAGDINVAGHRQRRLPSQRVRRLHARDPAGARGGGNDYSLPGSSTSTSPGGDLGPADSPGGTIGFGYTREPRDADRPHRRRPSAGDAARHDVDRPRRTRASHARPITPPSVADLRPA